MSSAGSTFDNEGPVAATTVATQIARAAARLTAAARDEPILLACHINPDGDALGSMLAVALGLRQLGFTAVQASFPEPFEVVTPFSLVPGLHLLVPPGVAATSRPRLGLSFDAATAGRLGELAAALAAASEWIVLDHHASNEGFGSIRLIDRSAAATAVIAAALLDQLGVVLNRDIAMCLYLGLATDTGSFRFDTTTPQVHRLAARLVAAGAQPAEVARWVFDTRPFAAVQLLGQVLGRAELDPAAAGGRGLVTAFATAADLARFDLPSHVLESYQEVVRTTAEADVCCMIKPIAAGEWAVSLRSRGLTDVGAVAVALGGGGHRLAAGFTATGEVGEVLALVRDQLEHVAAGATG